MFRYLVFANLNVSLLETTLMSCLLLASGNGKFSFDGKFLSLDFENKQTVNLTGHLQVLVKPTLVLTFVKIII